jgi:hypothetical protein
MWEQLTQADIERVRQLLATRRVEIVKRYEEELDRLDTDQAEVERLARAVAQFVEKFTTAPAKTSDKPDEYRIGRRPPELPPSECSVMDLSPDDYPGQDDDPPSAIRV